MNMICHNLCLNNKAPIGITYLLDLRVKYCVKQQTLSTTIIYNMLKRTRINSRWRYNFQTYPDDDKYIPGLHINSERELSLASNSIETRTDESKQVMRRKRAKYSRKYIHTNLTGMQAGLLED